MITGTFIEWRGITMIGHTYTRTHVHYREYGKGMFEHVEVTGNGLFIELTNRALTPKGSFSAGNTNYEWVCTFN